MSKLVIGSILWALVSALYYWMTTTDTRSWRQPPDPVSWAVSILIAVGIVVTWIRFATRRPHLTIDAGGLTNLGLSSVKISWADMDEIVGVNRGVYRLIVVWLKPGVAVPGAKSLLLRNRREVGGRLRLEMNSRKFTITHTELLKIVTAYHDIHS